jgi:ABC-type multidrug transport system ATPase subunit/ABC-type multidrug transport system permease subunit
MLFWLAAYLLNITSSVVFRMCAMKPTSMGPAAALASMVQVFFFLFSGYLIPFGDLPSAWKWAPYLSPQTWAYNAMVVNEISGEQWCNYPTASSDPDCAQADIDVIIVEQQDVWICYLILLCMFLLLFFLGYLLLKCLVVFGEKAPNVEHKYQCTGDPDHLLKPDPVTLTWHDLTYSVKDKKGKKEKKKKKKLCAKKDKDGDKDKDKDQDKKDPAPKEAKKGKKCFGKGDGPMKKLLNNVSGIARPGTMTALMGPSGAGKTTLLDVLAGRKISGKVEGDIRVNGNPQEKNTFLRISGYVEQFDSNCAEITVEESLMFSAEMRLPKTIPSAEKLRYCESVAYALDHFDEKMNEPVYELTLDQKKYLSVGVELVANPSILFLDEPTTGLDGLRALSMMQAVQKLSRDLQISVVCTIHQPSKPLFELFDHLVLLCKGGFLAYIGPTGKMSQDLISYLEGIPAITPIGEDVNPANWMLDEVGGGANPNPEKQQQIVEHFSSSEPCKALQADLDANSSPTAEAIKFEKRYAAPWTKQFHQLYYRAGRVYRRSPEYSVIRTLVMFVFAVIFGTAYWDMGWNIETDFWLRLAFIYTTTFYCGLTFLISGVSVLMGQRVVFYREKAAGMYSSNMYALAYMMAEVPWFTLCVLIFYVIVFFASQVADSFQQGLLYLLPFWLFVTMCTFLSHLITAISPNYEVANALGPGMASWFSSLCGFYLARPHIPGAYIWLYWLNPFRYTYESLAIAMMQDETFVCGPLAGANCTNQTANSLMISFGFAPGNNSLDWWYWFDQIVVALYTMAWIIATFIALKLFTFGSR